MTNHKTIPQTSHFIYLVNILMKLRKQDRKMLQQVKKFTKLTNSISPTATPKNVVCGTNFLSCISRKQANLTQTLVPSLFKQRSFSTDDSGFHDDFKVIRKKYEAKMNNAKPQDTQSLIKEVGLYFIMIVKNNQTDN
jgi:hypothetical protein